MLTSVTRRPLLSKISQNGTLYRMQPHRLVSTMPPSGSTKNENKQQREMHSTALREADATASELPKVEEKTSSKKEGVMASRFAVTAEVTVSKIFPAGFGWQTASVIAENNLGYAADSMAFALTTGFGDAVGVCLGHTAYYGIKKSLVDSEINMTREIHTGILLATAAFCSGSVWQPIVDVLQGANLTFSQVFAGTWVGCGTAFYLGLRGGRTILSGYLEHVHEPTYKNSQNDASLSVAIGGATGFFVGTDAAYLPDQNFLIDIVGIKDGTPDLTGAIIAGTSTSLGFGTAQTGLNVIFPSGKCWND